MGGAGKQGIGKHSQGQLISEGGKGEKEGLWANHQLLMTLRMTSLQRRAAL